jgi:hypothetical protein
MAGVVVVVVVAVVRRRVVRGAPPGKWLEEAKEVGGEVTHYISGSYARRGEGC